MVYILNTYFIKLTNNNFLFYHCLKKTLPFTNIATEQIKELNLAKSE